jgi:hypothetical protein
MAKKEKLDKSIYGSKSKNDATRERDEATELRDKAYRDNKQKEYKQIRGREKKSSLSRIRNR